MIAEDANTRLLRGLAGLALSDRRIDLPTFRTQWSEQGIRMEYLVEIEEDIQKPVSHIGDSFWRGRKALSAVQ